MLRDKWLHVTPSKRQKENEGIKRRSLKIHALSRGTYGRRRIASALQDEFQASINRVGRCMKEIGLKGISPKSFKRTTRPNFKLPNSPNLLKTFQKEHMSVNKIWVSDITYLRSKQGWLYLCTIIDLFSRKVVGWQLANHMRASLVIEAVQMALKSRKPSPGLIFHSDCGGQYKSRQFRSLLKRNQVKQSMTASGNCYDNAVAESFFGTLKTELCRGRKFDEIEQATSSVFEYIEIFYNRFRLHSSLGYLSPVQYEELNMP